MIKQFPSKLRGDKIGYELMSSCTDSWNRRGSRPLSAYLMEYETYGDGIVKHSSSYCTQWENLTDACLSLVDMILAEPHDKDLRQLGSYICHRAGPTDIRFALSIKHKENGKAQYFSKQLRKITTGKEHDRRFERLMPSHDGTPLSAWCILVTESMDWLDRAVLAMKIRDLAYDEGLGSYGDIDTIIPQLSEVKGDHRHALMAFIQASQACDSLEGARRASECCIHNTRNEEECAQKRKEQEQQAQQPAAEAAAAA